MIIFSWGCKEHTAKGKMWQGYQLNLAAKLSPKWLEWDGEVALLYGNQFILLYMLFTILFVASANLHLHQVFDKMRDRPGCPASLIVLSLTLIYDLFLFSFPL